MNFEFSEEQELLREQARGFLTEHCPPTAVRAVLEGEADYDMRFGKKSSRWVGPLRSFPRSLAGSVCPTLNWL